MEFEAGFTKEHPDFLPRLAKKYPWLTPQELRICAAIRAGKKNWEIADHLLFISPHRVEDHRYSIRKKLRIEHDQNLESFLMRFK